MRPILYPDLGDRSPCVTGCLSGSKLRHCSVVNILVRKVASCHSVNQNDERQWPKEGALWRTCSDRQPVRQYITNFHPLGATSKEIAHLAHDCVT